MRELLRPQAFALGLSLLGLQVYTMSAQSLPIRVNVGGPAYVDSSGNQWSGDVGCDGSVFTTGASIGNTSIPTVYQSERYANTLSCNYAVPNGQYTVTLRFAEISAETAGQRQFSITLDGVEVEADKFDPYLRAGGNNRATSMALTTQVNDGQVNVVLAATASTATLSAIEIVPSSGTLPYFSDVPPDDPNYVYAQFMKEKGITSGFANINNGRNWTFRGGFKLSRSQMAVFLVRSLFWALTGNVDGQTQLNNSFGYRVEPYFNDIGDLSTCLDQVTPAQCSSPPHPHYRWIQKLKELGITSGATATTYEPGIEVRRGHTAAFATRTFDWYQAAQAISTPSADVPVCFADATTAYGFYKHVYRMHVQGVVVGNCTSYAGVYFDVEGSILRSDMARFVVRGALGLANPPIAAGSGSGGTLGTGLKEYIRAGGRLLAIESSASSGSGGGSTEGLSSFVVQPSSILYAPSGGAATNFSTKNSVPVTWDLVPNPRDGIGGNQGSLSAGANGSMFYSPPSPIAGGSCFLGSGATCVYSLAVRGTKQGDPSQKSFGIVTVIPPATSGSVSVSPQQFTVSDAGGGPFSAQVTALSGVSWTATSQASWITITSGSSGLGNGTVGYSVASNGSGIQRSSTITVTTGAQQATHTVVQGGSMPQITYYSPDTGETASQTFSLWASDSGGAAQLRSIRMVMGTGDPLATPACVVTFWKGSNQIRLATSVATSEALADQWLQASDIQNENCILRSSGTSYSVVGSEVRLTINLTFQPAFSGSRTAWAHVQNLTGVSTFYVVKGSWNVPAGSNIQVTASPVSAQKRENEWLSVSASVTGTANPAVTWSVENGVGGSFLNATASNTQYLVPGNFARNSTAILRARSQADPTKYGQVTVTYRNQAPQVVGRVPPSEQLTGYGPQQLTFKFYDPDGITDLSMLSVVFFDDSQGQDVCNLTYDREQSLLTLYGGGGSIPDPPGSPRTVENSYCTVSVGGGSMAVDTGLQLELTFTVSFKASAAGRTLAIRASAWDGPGADVLQGLGYWNVY
ncbi:MAG: malectin domain-containing carbohydrate-binding protein [Bryobacteraceae bacterium]